MVWRLALRSLRRTPVSSAMAVLSLALGIGAGTALFSILDSLVLRALPVRDPASLVILSNGQNNTSWTNPQWEQVRTRPSLAGGALAFASTRFNLAPAGQTEFIDGFFASGELFDVVGVRPILGRTLVSDDDRRGGGVNGPVAVLSYGFWQRRYGGAASAVGQTVVLDRVPFTIVGVMEPRFFGLETGRTFDVAVPLATEALIRGRDSSLDQKSTWWLTVMFRLRAGQTLEQATRALRQAQPAIREATLPTDWPATYLKDYLRDPFDLQPAAGGESGLRTRYERPLVTLTAAVGLLLLIACANIANLLLARATARRHELAVRAALGASRLSLAWPLFAESLVLAGTGAVLGLVFARWAATLLVAALSTSVNRVFIDLSLNWTVLAFTLGLTTLAVIVFGTAPAFSAARARPQEALAERGRGTTGASRSSLSGVLVVVQVALSLVLVVCAGLLGRTFASLATLDLGFDREGVLVSTISTRQTTAQDLPAQKALLERVLQAARAVPGVRDAALSVVTPVSNSTWMYPVEVVGEPRRAEDQRSTHVNMVSPRWFSTYGTRVLAGRDVNERDAAEAPRVGLVNQAFVKKFLDGKDPIGRLVQQTASKDAKPPVTIVGVVADAVYRSLREPVPPTLYLPIEQHDRALSAARLSVRTAGPPPSTLIRPLTAAMGRVDGNLTFTFRPLADQVNAALMQERLVATLSGFFGVLAVLLATLGLYGVTAYAVSRRRGEIGIRMALGGTAGAVVRLMLRRVIGLVTAGVIAGGVASLWAARYLKTLLYGLDTRDPATFVTAAAVLATAAVLAGWLPARRAARVAPVSVLRDA